MANYLGMVLRPVNGYEELNAENLLEESLVAGKFYYKVANEPSG